MIYFLRHGLDDEDYIGGWSNVDLVKEGIAQIKMVGEFAVNNKLKVEKIVTSDIKRAITTADILKQYINKPIAYSKILRELDKGNITGLHKSAIKNPFKPENIYDNYPGGESMFDLYHRIKKDSNYLLSQDKTLFITHRGVINMLYFILNDRLPDLDKKQFSVEHASLHEYDPKTQILKRIY